MVYCLRRTTCYALRFTIVHDRMRGYSSSTSPQRVYYTVSANSEWTRKLVRTNVRRYVKNKYVQYTSEKNICKNRIPAARTMCVPVQK